MRSLFLVFLLALGCQKVTLHPVRGDIVEAVYGLGSVESESTFHARAAIVTSVREFFVSEGQDVQMGQRLFVTDQGAMTLAPFAGRVTDIPVTVQENLFPQTQILTLMNLEKLYLSVSLEQQGAMRIRPGVKAEISFEFFRNQKFTGQVTTVYPRQEQFVAKVAIDAWPAGVLPGMTADVAFEVARKQGATLVPARAVSHGHLLVRRDGEKLKLPVKVGLVDSEKAEILSPELTLDDEILLP